MPPRTEDLPCRTVVELLTDHLERALAPGLERRVEAHLVGCEDCTTYLEQLRATVDAVGRLPAEELPPGVRARLHAAFRDRFGGGA